MPRKPASGKPPAAYDVALRLLARREHSAQELKRKLAARGLEGGESREAIDRLQDQRYQDDERFAAMLVRNRAAQGYGPQRIRAELKTHAVTDARIRQLLEEAEVDWEESALDQLRRRYGRKAPADHAERARRAQFLLRRGFAAATVRRATHAEVDDAADEID
ncbi:regulatory protein RecX [Frateuria soli]|uniref:regulatory protein RecX n=1 Tax=Frateuria soli TaxID=1542730 RepID=UPI001E322831|nr:regulatory protein RecX [Frateuria soli]UGB37297.1 recombination regulator RecX [Frateuria soli]